MKSIFTRVHLGYYSDCNILQPHDKMRLNKRLTVYVRNFYMIKHGTNPCLSIDANALVCSSKIRSQVQTEEEIHLSASKRQENPRKQYKENLKDFQEANEPQHHSVFEGKTASPQQGVNQLGTLSCENTVIISMKTLSVL